jgi:hypothetical protein
LRAAGIFGEVFWRSGVGTWFRRRAGGDLTYRRARRPARVVAPRRQHELAFHHALVRDAAYAMLASRTALGPAGRRWLGRGADPSALIIRERRSSNSRFLIVRGAELALAPSLAGVHSRASRARAIGFKKRKRTAARVRGRCASMGGDSIAAGGTL